jgi:hypothetical protein
LGSYSNSVSGAKMNMTYVIFKKRAQEEKPVWVETVQGLARTKERFQHHAANSEERYFVFDVQEAKIVHFGTKAKSA